MMIVVRGALGVALALMVALGTAGCTAPEGDTVPVLDKDAAADVVSAPDEVKGVADTQEEVPDADPALAAEDRAGRTPTDAFNEHIAAVGTGDPEEVWSTYGCSPPEDYETWAFDWEDAGEVYFDVRVLEERVVASTLAYVRVAYRVTSGDDEIIVEEPGEWWRIEQVEGAWKVGWFPRQ
ncbi:MAG: hypothetical protein RBS17_07895 [Coriobacteriia bacterium]|nr:hypothetical protein [Coriobacteriia bacterium]